MLSYGEAANDDPTRARRRGAATFWDQQRPPSGRQDELFCTAHNYIGNSPRGPPTLRHAAIHLSRARSPDRI